MALKKWKKALFIYPYKKPEKFFYYDLFPPLGLEYIAAAVIDLVDNITIIDMRYERYPVAKYFNTADVIGINLNWPRQVKILMSFLYKIPKETTVIVGGIHATETAQEFLENNPRVDILVRGDGEETIRDIFIRKPLIEVAGISFYNAGNILHTSARKQSKEIEITPAPSLRKYRYKHRTPLGFSFGIDTVMSSRGCLFNCEFCIHKLNALGDKRGWSYKSAQLVVEEIKNIRAEVIIISDDNFTVDKDRVEKICDLLIDQKIKKLFMAECRVDIADHPELLKKMWEAGFRVMSYGIESARDKTLERIGKGLTVQDIKDAFKVLRNYRMISVGYFIIGYVGETEKDMLRISSFAHSLELDIIIPSKLRAIKYSPLRNIVEKTPGYHISGSGRVYSDQYPQARLKKIVRKILKDFYTKAQYFKILKKLAKSKLIFRPVIIKALIVFQIGKLEMFLKKRLMRPI